MLPWPILTKRKSVPKLNQKRSVAGTIQRQSNFVYFSAILLQATQFFSIYIYIYIEREREREREREIPSPNAKIPDILLDKWIVQNNVYN
jgi:hypothetical protein